MRALHAEFRKLFTTRTGYWLVILSLLLSAGIAILASLTVGRNDSPAEDLQGIITFTTTFAYTIAGILGIIGLTGEYRHQTITPTYLAVPIRSEVVAAKLVAYLVWGAVLGVLNLAVALILTMSLLPNRLYADVSLSAPGVHTAMWAAVVITAIFGIIGVGLGALLRNQAGAIVALVLYLFVLQNILSAIHAVRHVYTYLPGGLTAALTNSANVGSDFHLLHRGPAAVLLVAYGIGFAILGAALTIRRDVT